VDLDEGSENPDEGPASLDANQVAFDGSLAAAPAAQGVLGGDHPFPWVPWRPGADLDGARGETDADPSASDDPGGGPCSPLEGRAAARGGPWPRGAVALSAAGRAAHRGVPCAACEAREDLVAVGGGAADPGASDRSGNRGVGGRPGAVARGAVVAARVGGSSWDRETEPGRGSATGDVREAAPSTTAIVASGKRLAEVAPLAMGAALVEETTFSVLFTPENYGAPVSPRNQFEERAAFSLESSSMSRIKFIELVNSETAILVCSKEILQKIGERTTI
jgi:hypothetical protein